MKDVTKLHQEEEVDAEEARLRETRFTAIGQLLAGISHESRNLLTGILAFAQVGQRRLSDPKKMAEILARIEQETLRCIELQSSVLDYVSDDRARSDTACADSPSRALLSSAIASVVQLVEHQMSMKHIALESPKTSDKLVVRCPHAFLNQILLNLLINAMQATPEAGRVRLCVSTQSEALVRIAIEDSGPGIPIEDRVRIFETMYTTKQAGTGLGLAITRDLVKKHGGSISVGESALGGARFEVVLPLTSVEEGR
ncbi:MAG: HAMP domain-containing histidine kinase [Myxococcales bacterium]|nr:HAMP domain-containing histidine kinase [Myxococcales bacterium]